MSKICIQASRSGSRTTTDTSSLTVRIAGLDMVGKWHKSWPGWHVYMLAAVKKFTKWIEAAPVATQDSTRAANFIK
jgi:hypothetical protein